MAISSVFDVTIDMPECVDKDSLFGKLPEELVVYILDHLPTKYTMGVCRKWYHTSLAIEKSRSNRDILASKNFIARTFRQSWELLQAYPYKNPFPNGANFIHLKHIEAGVTYRIATRVHEAIPVSSGLPFRVDTITTQKMLVLANTRGKIRNAEQLPPVEKNNLISEAVGNIASISPFLASYATQKWIPQPLQERAFTQACRIANAEGKLHTVFYLALHYFANPSEMISEACLVKLIDPKNTEAALFFAKNAPNQEQYKTALTVIKGILEFRGHGEKAAEVAALIEDLS